jgi:hypothetical protein
MDPGLLRTGWIIDERPINVKLNLCLVLVRWEILPWRSLGYRALVIRAVLRGGLGFESEQERPCGSRR